MSEKFDCVVNHYRRDTYPEKVRTSAMLATSCLRAEPEVGKVVLVDGSVNADQWLSDWCRDNDIDYVHQGKGLSFAEGYNVGLQHCDSTWTVLSASDIYVPPGFFHGALDAIAKIPRDTLGCAAPYLSFCDLPSQQGSPRSANPERSALMTLNFNVFETALLREMGGVPERYSGCFNDVDLVLRMKERQRYFYLLPMTVLHYGRMTTGAGSDVSFGADDALFRREHPGLSLDGAFWGLRLRDFFASKRARLVLWPESFYPKRWLRDIQLLVLDRFRLH